MTRLQAKQFLADLGIAEPTDEQVTNYLNQLNGETQKEKDKADKYKEYVLKADELQAKLDELSNQNLSDIEKANKATEIANGKVSELEKTIKAMQIKSELSRLHIEGEVADKLITLDGGIDFATLEQLLSDREKNAVANYEKEKLGSTPNPSGNGGNPANNKTQAEQVAEQIATQIASSNKTSADIVAAYTK